MLLPICGCLCGVIMPEATIRHAKFFLSEASLLAIYTSSTMEEVQLESARNTNLSNAQGTKAALQVPSIFTKQMAFIIPQ
jgi:hypothetical protein